jgi:PPOX class probable F420-dependent enzyme
VTPTPDHELARSRFGAARIARLGTVSESGQPHLVPIVFALSEQGRGTGIGSGTIYSAVDGKPKTTSALRRLANVVANPAVSVLVDHYSEDWDELWWARADGTGRVLPDGGDEAVHAVGLLMDRYPQHRASPPPGPVLAIDVNRWVGWAARV